MITNWRILDVNPEPWAVGPVGVARRGGKMHPYVGRNQQLDAYKNAVREEMGEQVMLPPGPVELVFYFWRLRSEYTTPQARKHRKHDADLTNMQKATEDALQGIIFENDRDVCSVHSFIVEQGPGVTPRVVIGWGSGVVGSAAMGALPDSIRGAIVKSRVDTYTQPTLDEGPDVEDVF